MNALLHSVSQQVVNLSYKSVQLRFFSAFNLVYLAETLISDDQNFVFYLQHFTCSHITSPVPSHLFFFKPSPDLTYTNESFDMVFSDGLTLLSRNSHNRELHTTVSAHLQTFYQCTFRATSKYLNLYTEEEKKLCSTPNIVSYPH